MLPSRRAVKFVSLAVLLTSLTACASSPTGTSLEKIFAADPRLNPVDFVKDPNAPNDARLTLPPDFPREIPRYPNAQLKEVTQPTPQATAESGNKAIASSAQLTRWITSDPINSVASFYQNEFQANNWEILSQPSGEEGGTFAARRNDLQVTVSIQPQSATSTPSATPSPSQTPAGQNPEVATEFVIQYNRNTTEAPGQPTPPEAIAPQPSDPDFIDPVLPEQPTQTSETPDTNTPIAVDGSQVFTDISKAPQELRQHIEDLAALGVLPLEPTGSKSNKSDTTTQFEPSKTISRSEYARWLVAANNKIHANSPAQQIRLVSETAQPAFQDVPRTHPDFPIIQGLAEAGLISSPLSGDSTAVLFRPDAPLTREQLILWKVPIDTRQALPNASVDAVKQTWGFQDVARIDPKALRAVLADFQNSERSNIRRVFGYTTLFQPKKPVTRAEAAAALWYFGSSSEGLSAQDALQVKSQQNQPPATPEPVPSSSPSQEEAGGMGAGSRGE